MRNRNVLPLLLTALAVFCLLVFGGPDLLGDLSGRSAPGSTSGAASSSQAASGAASSSETASSATPSSEGKRQANPSNLPEIRESALPAEGRRTLALIRSGGPFRFSQDDRTFGNFERILPGRDRGYYREYTVPTPGEPDRGARRIVAGNGGEKYYTDDHYGTFKFIVEGS